MVPNNKTAPERSIDPQTETCRDKNHADREEQAQITSLQKSLCGENRLSPIAWVRKNRMSPKKRAESNDSALPWVHFPCARA
jgi:hypothetical protein